MCCNTEDASDITQSWIHGDDESASFILLLSAMVVKYGFDEPAGVEIMGPVHGVLFLQYATQLDGNAIAIDR